MVHKYLVITILTILLFGTISSFLVSYNYSGIGTSSSLFNSAFAAKAEKKTGNDSSNNNNKSESPETLKQQEKVTQLSQDAANSRLKAKLAEKMANNATENAQSLLAAALEADGEVKKLKGSTEKGSENKDLLTAALSDAKEKHHSAKLAEKNAKALTDKADALDKAADKAEKLAIRAQKQSETSAPKISNNDDADTKGQANTDKSNQNSKSTKDETSSKNSKDESAQNTNSLIESSQNNESTESTPVQPQSTVENKNENTSSSNDNQPVKERGIQKGTSASNSKEVTESNSGDANTISENISDTNTRTNTNTRDFEPQSDAGTGTDFGQILAQAEQNAHNTNTNTNANVTGPLVPEENKTALAGANSVSISNALTQNSTDLKGTQSPQPVNMSSRANTTLTGVDSPPSQSQNMSALDEGIQTGNDTAGNNTTRNSTGNSTINVVPTGLPNNNSAVSTSVNSTLPYQENAICNIAIENSTSSSTTSSELNMSTNKQDDGGCYPNDSTSGQFRYLVWSEGDEDNRFILFKRSTDGGKTSDNAITLSGNAPSAVFNPKLSSEGNNVFVVWQGDSNSGNQDIIMRKSTDNGKSFGSVINLSNNHAGSGNPEINVNASSVYVVWDGTTPGNNEIFYRRSLNNGSNFDSVRNLSNDGGVSYEPKVVINRKALEVYWRDFRNGHEDILVKKSINEGKTFDVLQKINKDILGLWKDRGVLDLRLNR